MTDNPKKLPKDKPLYNKAEDYPELSDEDFQAAIDDLAGKSPRDKSPRFRKGDGR